MLNLQLGRNKKEKMRNNYEFKLNLRSIQVDGKTIKAQIWDTAGINAFFFKVNLMNKLNLVIF